MQFSIKREVLLQGLRSVSGAIDRKQLHNPALSNVLLSASGTTLTLVGCDQEIELSDTVALDELKSSGETTVPYRKLADITRALPEATLLKIKVTEQRLSLTAGKSRFTLSTLDADSFPRLELTAATSFDLPSADFKKMLEKSAFAMADQDVRSFLNGMLFEVRGNQLIAVAADGHRMVRRTLLLEAPAPGFRIIVPRKAILELLRLLGDYVGEKLSMAVLESHLLIKLGDIEFKATLLAGKFPDFDKVLAAKGELVVTGDSSQLKQGFMRAAVLFSEKARGVRLHLANNIMKITAVTGEQDEAEEQLPVDFSGDSLDVSFNARYLIEYLSTVQQQVVKMYLSSAGGGSQLEAVGDDDGLYVLMPLRA